jgi:hypothetical protein
MQMMGSEAEKQRQMQLIIDDLCDIQARLTTIEAGQLTRKPPATGQSYASTAILPPPSPPPPARAEIKMALLGMTIIHSKAGTTPLKEVDPQLL